MLLLQRGQDKLGWSALELEVGAKLHKFNTLMHKSEHQYPCKVQIHMKYIKRFSQNKTKGKERGVGLKLYCYQAASLD